MRVNYFLSPLTAGSLPRVTWAGALPLSSRARGTDQGAHTGGVIWSEHSQHLRACVTWWPLKVMVQEVPECHEELLVTV